MLQLNENWDSYGRSREFQVDGIVVDEDASNSLLIFTIAQQLMIDTSEKIIEIKYNVNEHCPPMEIRNDMGVRVYMETKKENKNLGSYPLCIIVRDFNMELSITNENTVAGSSGTLKLLDMPTSSVIEEYESIIITDSTPNFIEVGQVYQDKQTIATAMKHYSVMHKFQFRVKRSSSRSYWLLCVGENCTWHFKATSINDSVMFKVRHFNSQHTCSLMDNTFIQRKPTSMVVGSMVIPKYSDPKTIYTPKDIQIDMLSEHGVNLTYMQAWRAKEKALQFLRGHPADSYNKLPIKLKKTADECFLYAFVAICTSISGWKYCRPVVVVDGTFLKSAYRGIMLTSSTMNAASTILPLAYAVVDSENAHHGSGFLSNSNMHMIEEIDPRVKVYLYDIDYHRWSRVHATVNRTWTMTSNIAESLNAVTKYARELPIVELLEYMRTLLERWTKEKLLKAKCTFTYLGFKFNKELDDNKTLSHKLRVRASTDYIHTVLDGVRRYIICLENKRCSCGQFQLDELPCPHALTALRHRDESFEQYCSPYYTRKNLLRTYEIPVNPMPDESK
ncbi:uncharacterized protein [Nicotiana sylvestris]|uniref:uncharacterized protein n=1 Tax=Nicotiana sylvestris TaxID=4096 RepID=UPI00388CA1E6